MLCLIKSVLIRVRYFAEHSCLILINMHVITRTTPKTQTHTLRCTFYHLDTCEPSGHRPLLLTRLLPPPPEQPGLRPGPVRGKRFRFKNPEGALGCSKVPAGQFLGVFFELIFCRASASARGLIQASPKEDGMGRGTTSLGCGRCIRRRVPATYHALHQRLTARPAALTLLLRFHLSSLLVLGA